MDLSEGRELGLGVGGAPSTSLLLPSRNSQSTPLGDHPTATHKSFFTVIPSSHFSPSPFNLPSCAGPKTGGGEETWEGESYASNLPYGFCPIIHKRGNEPGPKAIH